ncbi:MAG: MaoC/PaaZ C-terminal domain-containing protein [Betaproteobacteria bacterium]
MQTERFARLWAGDFASPDAHWEDFEAFAAVSGNTNPAHLDPEFARDSLFH